MRGFGCDKARMRPRPGWNPLPPARPRRVRAGGSRARAARRRSAFLARPAQRRLAFLARPLREGGARGRMRCQRRIRQRAPRWAARVRCKHALRRGWRASCARAGRIDVRSFPVHGRTCAPRKGSQALDARAVRTGGAIGKIVPGGHPFDSLACPAHLPSGLTCASALLRISPGRFAPLVVAPCFSPCDLRKVHKFMTLRVFGVLPCGNGANMLSFAAAGAAARSIGLKTTAVPRGHPRKGAAENCKGGVTRWLSAKSA